MTQPVNANSSIFISRSGNEDLISMSNASLMSIRKAPTRSLLEVINNQLLLIRINLQLLALWCQLWRMTFNTSESVDLATPNWLAMVSWLGGGFWSHVFKYSCRAFWMLSSFSWRILLAFTAAGTGPGMFVQWGSGWHRIALILWLLSHNIS